MKILMTANEVGKIIGKSTGTIRRYIRDERLNSIQKIMNGRVQAFIEQETLLKFMKDENYSPIMIQVVENINSQSDVKRIAGTFNIEENKREINLVHSRLDEAKNVLKMVMQDVYKEHGSHLLENVYKAGEMNVQNKFLTEKVEILVKENERLLEDNNNLKNKKDKLERNITHITKEYNQKQEELQKQLALLKEELMISHIQIEELTDKCKQASKMVEDERARSWWSKLMEG